MNLDGHVPDLLNLDHGDNLSKKWSRSLSALIRAGKSLLISELAELIYIDCGHRYTSSQLALAAAAMHTSGLLSIDEKRRQPTKVAVTDKGKELWKAVEQKIAEAKQLHEEISRRKPLLTESEKTKLSWLGHCRDSYSPTTADAAAQAAA